jgi:hypothetical protein
MTKLNKMRKHARAGKNRPATARREIIRMTQEQLAIAHEKSVEFGRFLERNTWRWRLKKAVFNAVYLAMATMLVYWVIQGGF